jgi:hypothetical protein
MNSLYELVYRLSVEPVLRERFILDPHGVAASLGLPPDEDTRAALKELLAQVAGGGPTPKGPGWGLSSAVTRAALDTSS